MTTAGDPLTELREAIDTLARASRVIIVHPDREAIAHEAVAASPFPGLLHVEVSPYCPVDRVFFVPAPIIPADVDEDDVEESA